jgi:hypothetical protein
VQDVLKKGVEQWNHAIDVCRAALHTPKPILQHVEQTAVNIKNSKEVDAIVKSFQNPEKEHLLRKISLRETDSAFVLLS